MNATGNWLLLFSELFFFKKNKKKTESKPKGKKMNFLHIILQFEVELMPNDGYMLGSNQDNYGPKPLLANPGKLLSQLKTLPGRGYASAPSLCMRAPGVFAVGGVSDQTR